MEAAPQAAAIAAGITDDVSLIDATEHHARDGERDDPEQPLQR